MDEQKFHVGVKALIVNNQKILVLKTNSVGMKHDNPSHWDLPGGRIKENDSVEETLRKEIKEELNVDNMEMVEHFNTAISNLTFKVDDENFGLLLMIYRCKIPDSIELKLSSEHTEYKWVSIEEAKELLKVKFPNSFIEKLDYLGSS